MRLSSTVPSFGGMPIYGGEFIDPPEQQWGHWRDRLSLDVSLSEDRDLSHVLDLFQEHSGDNARHLDLRIWFDDVDVRRRDGREMPLAQFIADGQNWWDGFNADDPRTHGHGIFPLGPNESDNL